MFPAYRKSSLPKPTRTHTKAIRTVACGPSCKYHWSDRLCQSQAEKYLAGFLVSRLWQPIMIALLYHSLTQYCFGKGNRMFQVTFDERVCESYFGCPAREEPQFHQHFIECMSQGPGSKRIVLDIQCFGFLVRFQCVSAGFQNLFFWPLASPTRLTENTKTFAIGGFSIGFCYSSSFWARIQWNSINGFPLFPFMVFWSGLPRSRALGMGLG